MVDKKRLTQRDIAQLAGVSQATVSLVLNGVSPAEARIPEETRERVIRVIRETGYVADPIARRMAKKLNRILGVFTYEPAFPSDQSDFFAPFLLGIEEGAQAAGYDLLLLTGGVAAGRRRIFAENNRLRLADGCLLLGRRFDRDELARLVSGDFPFMAVGRRDDAGGPVPYVGAAYAAATARLVERAAGLGHRQFAYVGLSEGAESTVDRWIGFHTAAADAGEIVLNMPSVGQESGFVLDQVRASGATVVFFTERADAVPFLETARAAGLEVPDDLSIVVLGRHLRAAGGSVAFTSYEIPREEMGRRAVESLVSMIESRPFEPQVLLDCDPVEGTTLGHTRDRVLTS